MRIPELKTAVADALDADIPAFVWGAPGIGKSEAVEQVARERNAAFIDIRLSMFDPVDLRGLPSILDGATIWNRPAIWPSDPTRETILFFDEMDRAPLAVLNAALQIVLNRRIGEHALPDSVRIVAAGNGRTDKGTNKLPGAAANRFAHFYAEFDPAAMREHFNAIGVDPLIVAFNHLRPALGYTKPGEGEDAYATPRQWERVNRVMHLPDSRRAPLVNGLVGSTPAGEFEAFVRTFRTLPPIPVILSNPAGVDVPSDPSALYAVATALARAATRENFANVQAFYRRMPQEFSIMGTTDAVKRDPALKETGAFIAWAAANQDVTL